MTVVGFWLSVLQQRCMQNNLRRIGLLLAVCFFASLAAAASTWQRLETDDFTIYSDASGKDIKDFAVNYAAFRQVLNDLFLPVGHKSSASTLVLFKRAGLLHRYGPISKGGDQNFLTFSTQVDGSALLALALSGDQDRACEVAFEFETIFAIQRAGCSFPIWVSQGTGMVLSSLKVQKGKCTMGADTAGNSMIFHGSNELLPWDKFFLTGRDSDDYKGKTHAGIFHAQAWALMHWVLLSQKHPREAFTTLTTRIREKNFIEAVEDTTGVKAKEFTSLIARHLNGRSKYYECVFDEQKVRAGFNLIPAPEAEVHVQLANLLAGAERYDEADAELKQALALAPEAACVKEAAARQASQNERKEEAVKLYRDALVAGTKNPIAYLFSAKARIDEYASSGSDYGGGGGPSTEVAIGEIKKALELNPSSMEAYRLLGRAFYILPQLTEERLAELTPALVSGADGCGVRFYRALLYERLGKLDLCASDLRIILEDRDISQWTRCSVQDRLVMIQRWKKELERRSGS